MNRGIVLTALVTPFDRSGRLNLAVLPELIGFQKAAGVDGLVIAGTNGEGPSMSVQERKNLLEAVTRLRGNLKIFAGTGAANLPDTIELTRHAASVGADAAMVLPPFFFKNVSSQGVGAFYRQVLDSVEIPILLYSIPQQSAVPITDEILDELRDHPRLAGLKDSAGELGRTMEMVRSLAGRRVFAGSDELLSDTLFGGAAGNISGTGNGFPDLLAAVRDSDISDRGAAQARMNLAKKIVLQYPLIAGNKSVLAHRGVPRMWVRPPLVDLPEPQEKELVARLRSEGLF